MSDPLTAVVAALLALVGFQNIAPRDVVNGEVVSAFPDAASPGEVVGNVLLVTDASWAGVLSRLEDPALQPGVLVGGRLDPEAPGDVDNFVRFARLDDGDPDRLRGCREGQCRLKVTAPLLSAQRALPERATDLERLQVHLRALSGLAACAREPACEVILVDRNAAVHLGPVARRLLDQPSLSRSLVSRVEAPGFPRIEWRTEGYWKREVLSLGRVQLIEGRLGTHRALLHRREMVFATHYFEGARVETLFVEVTGRLVVAQSNIFQTDKTSGFTGIERALIRLLGRRRFESQAREWRTTPGAKP
jgi:hypothetical protein